jgi:hypothetical protein
VAPGGVSIDWGAPWFAPWRETAERIEHRLDAGSSLPGALNQEAATPVRFVPEHALAKGEAYERHIFDSGTCPTRENLHDFFNGLCWLCLPLSKKKLNALQAGEIARVGAGGARGPVRDAITLFDENGALLHAPPPLWDALLARDWRRLFVDLRPFWGQARLLVFGHALLEKLTQPRKQITAHVWCSPAPAGGMAALDAWLAPQLSPGRLAAKPLAPLPLMGIPGWCGESENFSFYDDSLVFRPPAGKTS